MTLEVWWHLLRLYPLQEIMLKAFDVGRVWNGTFFILHIGQVLERNLFNFHTLRSRRELRVGCEHVHQAAPTAAGRVVPSYEEYILFIGAQGSQL